jgi:hypothetical protein
MIAAPSNFSPSSASPPACYGCVECRFSLVLDVSSFAQTLLDDTSAAAILTTLGIGPWSDADEADISSAISWDGTPPSGTSSLRYSWSRRGRMVHCQMRLEYASAGASNTRVTITLPSDMPEPRTPSGAAAGENMIACSGVMLTDFTGSGAATRAFMRKQASSYEVQVIASTSSAVGCIVSFSYMTDAE